MDIPDEVDPKESTPKVPAPWWHGEDGFFDAPWWFRYPAALAVAALFAYFFNAKGSELARWVLGIVVGFYVIALARELAILALICGVVWWAASAVQEMPVNVAIVVGALIIAAAVSRR
jgi:hypothetical protein